MSQNSNGAQTLKVDLGARSYDIAIGPDLLDRAGTLISERLGERQTVIITDSNVGPLYAEQIEESLAAAGHRGRTIQIEAGEQSKSFVYLETLLNDLLSDGLERSTVLVALGGGVIGDLTGFTASIALRGVEFVQIPTTLLAQVDSSVGGKTAINSPHGKNLVGTFYQPRLVVADTGTLTTLPPRELGAGYAETVKYGLLGDPVFFDWLETNGKDVLAGDAAAQTRAIVRACEMKAEIVNQDECETGRRALLKPGTHFRSCAGSRNRNGRHAVAWRSRLDRNGARLRFIRHARPLPRCGRRSRARTFSGSRPADRTAAPSDRHLGCGQADRAYGPRQEGSGRTHDFRIDARDRGRIPDQ